MKIVLPDLEAGDYIANYRDLDAFDGSRVESMDANGTITLSLHLSRRHTVKR